jgi:surfactin synthase thioesterase subunit
MKTKSHIKLFMPPLSPAAAYAFAQWTAELARQVELYYTEEIRTHQYIKGEEALELERMETQIEQERDSEDPDDPIPF